MDPLAIGFVDSTLAALPAPVVLAAAFAFPALEASVFLGVLIPGEIAIVLAGVLANQGRLPLSGVLAVAILGAVVGDSVGFAVGKRYGHSLLGRLPQRLVRPSHVEATTSALRRLGGRAVFVGRFTAALRALVPGMAGMSGMHYRTFAVWNVIGGVVWASAFVLLGYLAGTGYAAIEHRATEAGLVLLAVVAVVIAVKVRRHRRAQADAH